MRAVRTGVMLAILNGAIAVVAILIAHQSCAALEIRTAFIPNFRTTREAKQGEHDERYPMHWQTFPVLSMIRLRVYQIDAS